MNMRLKLSIALFVIASLSGYVSGQTLPIDTTDGWQMTWNDEFDYEDPQLDKSWEAQNGPSGHILCSRWRENAVVHDGILELKVKKESRGGQDWTAASLWTKKKFKYGYFECRYMYANAPSTNNSFWLMTRGDEPKVGKRFEIDINEGHVPNEVNTNIHQWSDFEINPEGRKVHYSSHKGFAYGAEPGYSIELEIPVSTSKIRFQTKKNARLTMGEFRVYAPNKGNYPEVLSNTVDELISGLVNLTNNKDLSITSSGSYGNSTEAMLLDGDPGSVWKSQEQGEKWLELEWKKDVTVGCIQFLNGWKDHNGLWRGLLSNYRIQYLKDGEWKDISVMNAADKYSFGEEFHTFGLQWDEEEIIFYFDGNEIRRAKNDFCYSESPIWLSLALVKWAGPVTDAVDGTSMKVDYVRYYQQK